MGAARDSFFFILSIFFTRLLIVFLIDFPTQLCLFLYTKIGALYICLYFGENPESIKNCFANRFYIFFRPWHKIGIYYANETKHQPMKNLNKTTVILKALDIELKKLLLNDLGNFKATRSGQKQPQASQAA